MQISDEARGKSESKVIGEDVISAEEEASSSFLGVRVSYSLGVTVVILVLFSFYRRGFKRSMGQSLDKESHRDSSLRSNTEHIQFSTAVELKNGFVQVLSFRHSPIDSYYSNLF